MKRVFWILGIFGFIFFVLFKLTIYYANPQWSKYIYILKASYTHRMPTPPANYTGEWKRWNLDTGALMYIDNYKDGKMDGPFIKFNKDGSKYYEFNYASDLKDGFTTFWYPDGTVSVIQNYSRGKLDGMARSYYPSGAIQGEAEFRNGVPISSREYSESGQIVESE